MSCVYGKFSPNFHSERAIRFWIIGYPRARLILEAQATLMSFLRRCVETLLENLTTRLHLGLNVGL